MWQAVVIAICVAFWGLRLFILVRFQTKRRTGPTSRRVWRLGTPDWITRVTPVLELLGWLALALLIVWLTYGLHKSLVGRR